jgi:hypothetical protein
MWLRVWWLRVFSAELGRRHMVSSPACGGGVGVKRRRSQAVLCFENQLAYEYSRLKGT